MPGEGYGVFGKIFENKEVRKLLADYTPSLNPDSLTYLQAMSVVSREMSSPHKMSYREFREGGMADSPAVRYAVESVMKKEGVSLEEASFGVWDLLTDRESVKILTYLANEKAAATPA